MLVLDANILIRAVLGSRVLELLLKYVEHVDFLSPDSAFNEARESLPAILERRNLPLAPAMALLDQLTTIVQTVEAEAYQNYESVALQRIARRDEDDWPILAAALALNCSIWTEDTDFFGLWRCNMDNGSCGIVLGQSGAPGAMRDRDFRDRACLGLRTSSRNPLLLKRRRDQISTCWPNTAGPVKSGADELGRSNLYPS